MFDIAQTSRYEDLASPSPLESASSDDNPQQHDHNGKELYKIHH